jgi:hypothetical protein
MSTAPLFRYTEEDFQTFFYSFFVARLAFAMPFAFSASSLEAAFHFIRQKAVKFYSAFG